MTSHGRWYVSSKSRRELRVSLPSPIPPPTPNPDAEKDIADAKDEMSGTEQSEQPPGVADDAVEGAANVLLQTGPWVRDRVVSLRQADCWDRRRCRRSGRE